MRKWFVRFLQVVCLLQLSAFGQLNAHPNVESTYASITDHHNKLQPLNFATGHDRLNEKISPCPAPPGDIIDIGFENIEEQDYELGISKKSSISKDYFAPGFRSQLIVVCLSHNCKNSLAFSRQTSFVTANRKHVILQVFRI